MKRDKETWRPRLLAAGGRARTEPRNSRNDGASMRVVFQSLKSTQSTKGFELSQEALANDASTMYNAYTGQGSETEERETTRRGDRKAELTSA